MDIESIIEALGGTAQVQALLGVGPSAVSNYRMRGQQLPHARGLPRIRQSQDMAGAEGKGDHG